VLRLTIKAVVCRGAGQSRQRDLYFGVGDLYYRSISELLLEGLCRTESRYVTTVRLERLLQD
jgi:hypothetical protein